MNTQSLSPHSASRAEKLYRSLLLLYPASFRHAYEHEMLQTFRDCYRDTLQHEGVAGLAHLWNLVLRDLVVTACSENVQAISSFLKQMLGLQVTAALTILPPS